LAGRLAFFGAATILLFAVGCAQLPPSTAQLQSVPSARQDLIDRIVASTVKVAVARDARLVAFASGVVIASRPATPNAEAVSYVLTAAHALSGGGGATIFVGFCGPEAARGKVAATVVSQGTRDTLDLALLRVPGLAAPPVLFPTDDRVRLGQPILVVGFPEGQRLGISGGIVSQLPLSGTENGIPADRVEHRIMIDAAAPRGVSGGGVFEADTGHLVGIVQGHQTVSVAVKDQTQNYALKFPVPGATFVVPAGQIRPFLARPEVATELSSALPVTAHAVPALPR
jgi:S1-C subfamily serine protease